MFSSVQFSHSVVSDSFRPRESQHARPPCPSPTPGVHWDSRPSSQWCHPKYIFSPCWKRSLRAGVLVEILRWLFVWAHTGTAEYVFLFSGAMCYALLLNHVWLCDLVDCSLPGTSVHGGFSRQECWSRFPCHPSWDLPNPGIEPKSPALQADSLLSEAPGKPFFQVINNHFLLKSVQEFHLKSMSTLFG